MPAKDQVTEGEGKAVDLVTMTRTVTYIIKEQFIIEGSENITSYNQENLKEWLPGDLPHTW